MNLEQELNRAKERLASIFAIIRPHRFVTSKWESFSRSSRYANAMRKTLRLRTYIENLQNRIKLMPTVGPKKA